MLCSLDEESRTLQHRCAWENVAETFCCPPVPRVILGSSRFSTETHLFYMSLRPCVEPLAWLPSLGLGCVALTLADPPPHKTESLGKSAAATAPVSGAKTAALAKPAP